jgi:hypothetical protein
MKIAVCFSGQIRTGVPASPNIINYIGNLWDHCTFFAHTWNVNTRKPFNANGIHRDGYPLDVDTVNKFTEIYGLYGKIVVEDYDQIVKTKNTTAWNPMHYSWRRSIEVMQNYQKTTNLEFDLVVKLRPDVLSRPIRNLSKEIANALMKFDKDTFFAQSIFTNPQGIIDDVEYFAIPEIMDRASKFAYVQETTGMLGLKTYLEQENIKLECFVKDLPELGYAILREESLHRDPVLDWQGCYDDDMKFYQPL